MQNEKLAYSIVEAAKTISISKSFMYQLVEAGEIASAKIGTRRVILKEDLEKFLKENMQNN